MCSTTWEVAQRTLLMPRSSEHQTAQWMCLTPIGIDVERYGLAQSRPDPSASGHSVSGAQASNITLAYAQPCRAVDGQGTWWTHHTTAIHAVSASFRWDVVDAWADALVYAVVEEKSRNGHNYEQASN